MTAALRPMRLDDAAAVAGLTTQLGYPVEAREQAARISELLANPRDNALLEGYERIKTSYVYGKPLA